MNIRSLFSQFCHSPIPRLASVVLVTLAWASLAFCAEIHDAAKDGDLAKVEVLLKGNPALVFSEDNDGSTPLHIAATTGHKDVAELLLANGAEVNAKGNKGSTPLLLAAVYGQIICPLSGQPNPVELLRPARWPQMNWPRCRPIRGSISQLA